MKTIKDELQHIILGDEPSGQGSALKKTQTFLRGYAETSRDTQKQQYVKNKEAEAILAFAKQEKLFYEEDISESDFISQGAEQKVYRLNEFQVIKTNAGIFMSTGLIILTACCSTIISFLPPRILF